MIPHMDMWLSQDILHIPLAAFEAEGTLVEVTCGTFLLHPRSLSASSAFQSRTGSNIAWERRWKVSLQPRLYFYISGVWAGQMTQCLCFSFPMFVDDISTCKPCYGC